MTRTLGYKVTQLRMGVMGRAYLNTSHVFWNTCEMNAFIQTILNTILLIILCSFVPHYHRCQDDISKSSICCISLTIFWNMFHSRGEANHPFQPNVMFFCHTKLFRLSSTNNTASHYLARVMYVMETFQLSWYLIKVIEINANGIARNITYSRGSRSVFANCLIIWNEKSNMRNPFRHARDSMENSRLGVLNTCYTK